MVASQLVNSVFPLFKCGGGSCKIIVWRNVTFILLIVNLVWMNVCMLLVLSKWNSSLCQCRRIWWAILGHHGLYNEIYSRQTRFKTYIQLYYYTMSCTFQLIITYISFETHFHRLWKSRFEINVRLYFAVCMIVCAIRVGI